MTELLEPAQAELLEAAGWYDERRPDKRRPGYWRDRLAVLER